MRFRGLSRTRFTAAVALGVLAGSAAWGQDSGGEGQDDDFLRLRGPSRITARLGAFFPSAETRTGTNGVWFAGQIAYGLLPPSESRAFDVSAYFDAGFGLRREQIDFQEFLQTDRQFYGLGLSTTLHLLPRSRPGAAYVRAGGGPYLLRRSRARVYEYPDLEGETDEIRYVLGNAQAVTLGYQVGLGFRVGRDFFLEATYQDMGRLEGVAYRGTTASVGMRF